MITKEEADVVTQIQLVGRMKYYSALHVLADTLGVDVSGEEDHGEKRVKEAVEDMLLWMRGNLRVRRKEFEEAGLDITIDPADDHGQYRNMDVHDRDTGYWRIHCQSLNDGNRLVVWDSSWKNLLYLGGNQTADSAMQIVSDALKCLSRWQSIAAKYNILKGTCASAYEKDSLERAEKARHQLELLEKL